MTPEIAAAYGQLLSLGVLFIGFHCVGMCGPILCGLQIGQKPLELVYYQLGRGIIYMTLGATVGLLGAAFKQHFAYAGAIFSILIGLAILLQVKHLLKIKAPKLSPKLLVLQPGEMGLVRPLFFGISLAFMPCMISLWALGIAATTGSPMHGALIMALLVLMTTPALWAATRLPKLLGSIKRFAYLKSLSPVFVGISGCWLIAVGLAGLGVIEHLHAHFKLFGETYMLMFW